MKGSKSSAVATGSPSVFKCSIDGGERWSTTSIPWEGGANDLGGGDHFLPDGWYPYLVRWEYTDNGILYREQKTGRILMIR